MQIALVKFKKNNKSWDIGFEITLSDEELSICDLSSTEHERNFEVTLDGNIMSVECNFPKENLNTGERIYDKFGLILTSAEQAAYSHLI